MDTTYCSNHAVVVIIQRTLLHLNILFSAYPNLQRRLWTFCMGTARRKGYIVLARKTSALWSICLWLTLYVQEWFNGKLGAVGLSYDGFNVYSLLGDDAPIKLSAAIPIATSPSLYNLVYRQDEVLDISLHSFWSLMMDYSSGYHD